MKLRPCMVRTLTCTPLIVSLLSTATAAESPPGAIVGIITDAVRVPVVHVTVTPLRADGRAIRATVSGSDGVYSFANLPPGA
jgi:hypothetical protein